MEQLQTQNAEIVREWCDTALPRFAAEVERNFVFKGLAREFRVQVEVDSLVDLALAVLVPRLQPVIRAWYSDRGPALVNLLPPVDRETFDGWLVGDVRHWTARWNVLDPAHGGSAPATSVALAELRTEIRTRPLPAALARAVERMLAATGSERRRG